MTQIIIPDFLIISTFLVGMINLLTPFVTQKDSNIRNYLLITVSLFFLGNVIIIDWLFLGGAGAEYILLDMGKYSIAFSLEPLGLIFLTLLSVLWICAILYTSKFLVVNEMKKTSRFLFFLNCCVLTGCIIALSANLFTMFIGYELLTLCTIPLIAHQRGEKVKDGLFKYLKILMISGFTLFLSAIIIIYSHTGHGTFTSNGFIEYKFSNTYSIFLLVIFIWGISKTAIYPLHSWLVSAMIAPYPVSALLHAVVVVKAGLFCIYKVLTYVFGLAYLQSLFADYNWLVLIPIWTVLYSSIQALRTDQIKMVLAYSTINQLSLALMSAFLLTPKGLSAAVIHMVSHSLTKICIFYAAGNFFSATGAYKISELSGIRNIMPKTSLILLIASLSLIGLPPFAGFISKFYIIMAAAEQENILVLIVLVISTICSTIYMIKILIFVYKPSDDNLISNLKLRPYFIRNYEHKLSKKILNRSYNAEDLFPIGMILSIAICLIGVVFFFFIQQIINKFLMFM